MSYADEVFIKTAGTRIKQLFWDTGRRYVRAGEGDSAPHSIKIRHRGTAKYRGQFLILTIRRTWKSAIDRAAPGSGRRSPTT